jgi:hypothetical protein
MESAVGVAVSGGYAYVAVMANDVSLWVIDVSDPPNSQPVGGFDTQGLAVGVAVSGDYAYVAASDAGLCVIDVSDHAHPQQVGRFDTRGTAVGVAVSGDYAYVADGDAGLRVADVSNPARPLEVGSFNTPGRAEGVAISNGCAFVADGGFGLRVIDVFDPANPYEVGYYDTPGYARGVAVGDSGLVFVADSSSFGVYDCSEAMGVSSSSFIPHPSSFILSAYPNPFNSTTTIRFTLPRAGQVSLTVYDVLGRRVRELTPAGWFEAGERRMMLDGKDLSTGVYYLRANTGVAASEQQITLIK